MLPSSKEARVVLALQALQNDERLKLEAIAKLYDIPASTLLWKIWPTNCYAYDYQRAKCEDPEVIGQWFALVRNTKAKYSIVDNDIYNFDETGFIMGIIFAGMIKHFDYYMVPRAKGIYRLLILDGHKSHHSTEFELCCQESKIITLCMPPHSSHLLQPLDVGCFGPLKQAYGRQIEDLMRMHINHVSKLEFLCGFREAFSASLTEKNIRGGFAGAGLVPYDLERVLSKLDIKLHATQPPGS
ncbi:hypothetical protein VTK56DRAFT_10094 [Thermocarpiscus australiensis]